MSSLDYLDLCRLCLVKDRVSVPIFEGEGDVRQIFLKIAACLPVKVGRDDKLPKKICDDCVYKVELFYQFWNTTANAEKQLLQWLGEVSLDEKQGYVTDPHNPSMMKPDQSVEENRLDGTVMQQVTDHTTNMGMAMMDGMAMGMSLMIPNSGQQQQQSQQQMTSVPIVTSGSSVQNVQAVPGPSAQIVQQKISAPTGQDEEEDESEEEDNSDDECDADDGLPVKEESEEEPSNSRTIEPTTFVNVSLACDEAGPSGLQQQKIGEMPEMVMPPTDGDPKSGSCDGKSSSIKKPDDSMVDHHDNFARSELENNSILWERTEINVEERRKRIVSDVIAASKGIKVVDSSLLHPTSNVKKENDEEMAFVDEQLNDRENEFVEGISVYCDESEVGWYSCYKCGIKFPLESMLNRHTMRHVSVNAPKKLKKSLSSKSSNSRDSYHNALGDDNFVPKTENNGESSSSMVKRHICNFCDFDCDKREILTSHLASEHDIVILPEVDSMKYEICSAENLENVGGPSKKVEGYSCERCNFSCKKRSALRSHVNKKHRAEEVEFVEEEIKIEYQCDDIDEPREEEANDKNNQQRQMDSTYNCDSCSFETTNKRTLSSHKRRHHSIKAPDDIYFCNECDFKTEKKSSLYSHIKRKHKLTRASSDDRPELFKCNQCDYTNKNKYELKVHVARKHTDDFKFSCETCTKKFKVKGDLTNHVRFSHREQPVICDVCGKTCLNTNSLYVHQKFAHYKAKYECNLCKRRMVSQENLDEHMLRQHEKRESVVCEECGKTFSRNSRLKIHMRIHTGDRPYNCHICTKTFARSTALKQHLLIHTGVRPYVCDVCGKAFTQKPGLISHRKCHPGPLPPLPRVRIDHILNEVLRPNS